MPAQKRDQVTLYQLLKRSGEIKDDDRILLATGERHFVTLMFRQDDLLILNSLEPHIEKMQLSDALPYLLECLQKPGLSVVKIETCTVPQVIVDEEGTMFTEQDAAPEVGLVKDIWFQKITPELGSVVIPTDLVELKVHDIMSLKPGCLTNDTIIQLCSQALMKSQPDVYVADPVFVEQLLKRGPTLRIDRKFVPLKIHAWHCFLFTIDVGCIGVSCSLTSSWL